jgi:hypothetical protein
MADTTWIRRLDEPVFAGGGPLPHRQPIQRIRKTHWEELTRRL